jgi:hypothetical protein
MASSVSGSVSLVVGRKLIYYIPLPAVFRQGMKFKMLDSSTSYVVRVVEINILMWRVVT